PGNKDLEPIRYMVIATATSGPQCQVEVAIQRTLSLLSQCLVRGENVALVLQDIRVLLIEGTKVQMKYYYKFLQLLNGENLEKVVSKVPQLLKKVVSPVTPVASLSFSGRV
ncbi:hypothetical protein N332_02060, partial [Mesitornis unicolor]